MVTLWTVVSSAPAGAVSLNMVTTGATSQPIGHHEFCLRHGNECAPVAAASFEPATLTQERWATLLEVNTTVNRRIMPLTDLQIHGVEEVWSYPVNVGDCEDYVLLKRKMLMERGFGAEHLLITVVLQPDGLGHADSGSGRAVGPQPW